MEDTFKSPLFVISMDFYKNILSSYLNWTEFDKYYSKLLTIHSETISMSFEKK